MTTAGRRMSIKIDRDAFNEFFKKKAPGLTHSAIAAKAGINETTLSSNLGQKFLSLQNIEKIAKAFDVTMWNLPFVNDEAYTISFKLTTDLDIYWRARMIDQIRGLLANGIPQDKVRDIVLSDIFAGKYTRGIQSDSESKACLAPTPVLVEPEPSSIVIDIDEMTPIPPNGMQNKRLYAEKASEYESSEISKLHSELNKAKFRIANMEGFLSSREQTTAQALATEIVEYLLFCSENGPRHVDKDSTVAFNDHMDNIIKFHGKWSVTHESCELLHISVKKRPLLDAVYFFIVNSMLLTGYDAKYVDDIKFRLYEEVDIIGRYPINTNTDDVKACEKEEETEND